jgi:hypothetical protein
VSVETNQGRRNRDARTDDESAADFEVLEELLDGELLVSFRRAAAPKGAGEAAGNEQISVGWFPAPEPWLAPVLPL